MQPTSYQTTDELINAIRAYERRIAALTWSDELAMLNQAGIRDAIVELQAARYVVVFADINRLKQLNSITGSHSLTNRYLRDGLRVRRGELAGQYYGDEFVFILTDGADAPGFVNRITHQLAEQPLTGMERAALELIDGSACLSATFAWRAGVYQDEILGAIEQLSREVLATKAQRDKGVS